MPSLDIFLNNPAFSLMSLTASIDKVPFLPGQVGKLGIFAEEGISTTSFEVELRNGTLYLVPNTPRGAPALQNTRDPRLVRFFKPTHLPVRDRIMADEIQNKRSFGTENDLETAEYEVARRQVKMARALDATIEFQKIGALQGRILDSNGTTVIYNLFNEYGVVQQTLDFTLGTATANVLGSCVAVRGLIQDALGQDGGDDLEVGCFAGAQWFAEFISHPLVREAYKYYETTALGMNPLQQDMRYVGFKFGGIMFWQYRGNVGGVPFVAPGEANFFPMNVPDLYKVYYAPADYMETANTEGRPRYMKIAADPSGFNKFVQLEVQANPLAMCHRPECLIKGLTSN